MSIAPINNMFSVLSNKDIDELVEQMEEMNQVDDDVECDVQEQVDETEEHATDLDDDTEVVSMTLEQAGIRQLETVDRTEPLDDGEYPELGVQQEEQPKKAQGIGRVNFKANDKFLVASSRIAELRSVRQPQRGWVANPRPVFNTDRVLDAKTSMAERAEGLKCTKPCQFVKFNDETKEWGVCYREVCTFAHGFDQLQQPKCLFGEKCNRRNGTQDRQGKIDKTNTCQFMHPDETTESFYVRTKRDKPQLPETSVKTHQPKPRRVQTTQVQQPQQPQVVKTQPLQRQNAMGSKQMTAWAIKQTPMSEHAKSQVQAPTVLRVPEAMAAQAMELALKQGLRNIQLVLV